MKGVCIVGGSKTGTTGLYSSVRSGLLETVPHCYGLMEKYDPSVFTNLERLAPRTPVVAKLLLTNNAFNVKLVQRFDKHVLTCRDPRDTLVSVALYNPIRAVAGGAAPEDIEAYISLLREKEQDPQSHSFVEILTRGLQLTNPDVRESSDFSRRYRLGIWANRKLDAYTARYEEFVAGQFDDLSDYLGFEVRSSDPSDYSSLVVRSRGTGDWRKWFIARDVDTLRPFMADYMRTFNYPDDWELLDDPQIDSSTGSEYVERGIEKRRHQMTLSQQKKPDEDTLVQLRERADEGASNAAFQAARVLEDLGGGKHDAEIRERLTFAACCGHVRAMKKLALVLENGIGGPPDLDEARRWVAEAEAENERIALRRAVEEASNDSQLRATWSSRARRTVARVGEALRGRTVRQLISAGLRRSAANRVLRK